MKLTAAQKIVLDNIKTNGRFTCDERYKPALKLVELGVANSEPMPYGRIKLTLAHDGQYTDPTNHFGEDVR